MRKMSKKKGRQYNCSECGGKMPAEYTNFRCIKPGCIGVYTMGKKKQLTKEIKDE